MHDLRLLFAPFLAGSLLAGCAVTDPQASVQIDPSLQDSAHLYGVELTAVRAMSPQGPAFSQGLRTGYLELADGLYENAELLDAAHFARKTVASAQGYNVQPDMPRYWALESNGEVEPARSRLVAALDRTGRRTAPTASASAQTAYDCWLERLADEDVEGAQTCRTRFDKAMAELEQTSVAASEHAYLVFFGWNSASISPGTAEVLDEVAATFATNGHAAVVVAGHADTSGAAGYNLILSRERAEVVAEALIDRTVPREVIEIGWFGEERPLVETADGVREERNRRVEILVDR